MSKRLIMKIFTPVITFLMALILVTTTLAWYTFVLESEDSSCSTSITATINEGGEGYDAIIDIIGDSYSNSFTKDDDGNVTDFYTVDSSTEFAGYCGQTGLPDLDSVYDVPYIIFIKAVIEVPDLEKYGSIDMAYVNGVSIYWEKDENGNGFDQNLINNISDLDFLDDEKIAYLDSNDEEVATYEEAKRLQIDLNPICDEEGNVTSPNELSYNQWKVIMLEKESVNETIYKFASSSIMILDKDDPATENGSLVYYIGIKFHNGSNNRFVFSDTMFTGCQFTLDLKFVSSTNNKYITLESNENPDTRMAPTTITNNSSRVDTSDWITKYTYDYMAKMDEYLRIYNVLTEEYIKGFVNFDPSSVGTTIINGKEVEYYKTLAAGQYSIVVTVFRDHYEIIVTTDASIQIAYEGDTNSWGKDKLLPLTDANELADAVSYINEAYTNAINGVYSAVVNKWYVDHLASFNSNDYTIYRTSTPITSTEIFNFDLISTNMDVYQNGLGNRITIAPGTYYIYAIVPKSVDTGKVSDANNVTVVYHKINDVETQPAEWWVKCVTNSWTATDAYKLTQMPGVISKATSFDLKTKYFTINEIGMGKGNDVDLRFYYVKDGNTYKLNNDDNYLASKIYYTFTPATGVSETVFNQGEYYEANTYDVSLTPYYVLCNHYTAMEGVEYYELGGNGTGNYVGHDGKYYYQDGSATGASFTKVDVEPGSTVYNSYFVKTYEVNSAYSSSKTINNAKVYFTCSNGALRYIELDKQQFNIANKNNMLYFGYESLNPFGISYESSESGSNVTMPYFKQSTVLGRIENLEKRSYAFMLYYYEIINKESSEAEIHGNINILDVK